MKVFTFLDGRTIFPMIQCGKNYSLVLFENGTLFSCGKNKFGQLGLKDENDRNIFHKVPFDKNIIQISAGDEHALVLTEDFCVYACGWNEHGQLGLNDTTHRNDFQCVTALKEKKIIQIECGDWHSCALTDDGFVYSWGDNRNGQLGHGDTNYRKTPTLIDRLTKIKKVYCGRNYTMAINESDELYVWGFNANGQLGLGDCEKRLKPTLNSFFENKKIIKMACGSFHSLALIENGEVYGWGNNFYGQLGLGDTKYINTPTLISFFEGLKCMDVFAFSKNSFVLLDNYDIYAFGENDYLFEDDETVDRLSPEKISFLQDEIIINIAGGSHFAFFISENEKIYGIGDNTDGQLGIGSTNETLAPKLIPFIN